MKTIKELADEIGKSKTTIMQRIDELGLRTSLQMKSNKFLVPDDTAEKIIASFNDETQSESKTEVQPVDTEIRNEYIEFLKSEIEQKNNQIADLQRLLHQEQQLRLVADQKLLMLESKNEPEPESEADTTVVEPTKKWWQFWR